MTGANVAHCPQFYLLLKIYFNFFEVSHILYVCVFVYGEPTDQRRQPHPETRAAGERAGLAPARGAFCTAAPVRGALAVPSTADRRCFRRVLPQPIAFRPLGALCCVLVFEHTLFTARERSAFLLN